MGNTGVVVVAKQEAAIIPWVGRAEGRSWGYHELEAQGGPWAAGAHMPEDRELLCQCWWLPGDVMRPVGSGSVR